MMEAPRKIYLQISGSLSDDDEITWCSDQVNDDDVAYVREDKTNDLAVRNEALEAAYKDWQEKTEWVQEEFEAGKLPLIFWAMHRADIIRNEIYRLRAERDRLRAALEIIGNGTITDGWIQVAPQFIDQTLKGED